MHNFEAHPEQKKNLREAELLTTFREAALRHILNKRKAYEGQGCWLIQIHSFEAHPKQEKG